MFEHNTTPGYLFTKQFTAFTFDVHPRHVWTWPFCEVYWEFPYESRVREDIKWSLHFLRRMSAQRRLEKRAQDWGSNIYGARCQLLGRLD